MADKEILDTDGEITDVTEDTDASDMSDAWTDEELDVKRSPNKKRMGKTVGISKISELASRIHSNKLVAIGESKSRSKPSSKEDEDAISSESDDDDFVPEKLKKTSHAEQSTANKWPLDNSKVRFCTSTGKIKEVASCSIKHKGAVFNSVDKISTVLESSKFIISDATIVLCEAKNTHVFYRTAAVFNKNEWTFVVLSSAQEVHIIKNTLSLVEKPQNWQDWKLRATKFENNVSEHGTEDDIAIFGKTPGSIYLSTQLLKMKHIPRKLIESKSSPTKNPSLTSPIVKTKAKRKRTTPSSILESTLSVTSPVVSDPVSVSTPLFSSKPGKKTTNGNKKQKVDKEPEETVSNDTSDASDDFGKLPVRPICEVKFNFCTVEDVKRFFEKNKFDFSKH